MINTLQLVWGVMVACVFIALGLIPGLIHELAHSICNAADILRFHFPVPSSSRFEFEQPRWFAMVGTALILITILLYIWK